MPKRSITTEDLLRIKFVSDPQVSPDGGKLLFVRKHIDDKNKYITNLFTVDRKGELIQWTQGDSGAGHPRWSPDGSKIAFVSSREGKKAQIFLIGIGGGEARKLTGLPEGSIGEFKWSPDGSRIAFTFREQHGDWTEAAKKEREEKGFSTPPRVFDDGWYRLDGDGYFGPQRYAIHLADAVTGETRKVYAVCPVGDYSFDWSPDSRELAVTHTVNKNFLADKPNDQIFRVDMDGQSIKLDGLPKGVKSSVKWSPDGKTLAYLGDDDENDPWGVKNTKLFIVSIEGGAPKCLTREDDYCLTVMGLSDTRDAYGYGVLLWSPDSKACYVSIGWHGRTQLAFVQIDKGKVELLTAGDHTLSVGNLSKDGETFGCTLGTATKLPEAAIVDLNRLPSGIEVLTDLNDELHSEIELSEPETFWIESTNGANVQAWVMKPIGYLEPKRYPAVLEVHGGPHAQYGWAFFHEFQVLAAEGYVVVYGNPRGSKGYGEKFCEAIRGSWGAKDWDDVQALTRWMQHQPYIHPGKIGIMGGSYGGYMTCWAIGHSKDYKAAIADRCVSNIVSESGNSDYPWVPDAYWKGAGYGSLERIESRWKSSPIAYFEGVETPTLIIHSEGDLRCNVEQAEQVFSALQLQGVESRFVRYPASTSHGLSRSGPPDLRLHRLGQITEWWRKHL